jgi:glycosyltransferase involved in cell wall biosynthesis
MMPATLASILINNYNYGRFLGQAIGSAVSQDYPERDSGGGPPTILAKSFSATQTVSFRSSSKTGGQASVFNAGVAGSRGDILCFLDADEFPSAKRSGSLPDPSAAGHK